MFGERGFVVDHSTINRWVLAYAPMIEKRLRQFRRPHCGSVRVDETYVKIRGKWRYLYRAIDKHGNPMDFLLTAKRDLDAAKRFFRKMLKDEPLLSPNKIGTDGANTFPSTIKKSVDDGLLHPDPVHYVTKHLQQGIESDHFRVKKNMPKIGGFQSFNTARRTIAGFEAMLWLRKGFGLSGVGPSTIRTICLRASSDCRKLTKHETEDAQGIIARSENVCDRPSFDRQIRIERLATTRPATWGSPTDQSFRRYPNGQTATAAKRRLILRPVRHFELHFSDVMAAGGVMFVRHAGSINLFSIRPHR